MNPTFIETPFVPSAGSAAPQKAQPPKGTVELTIKGWTIIKTAYKPSDDIPARFEIQNLGTGYFNKGILRIDEDAFFISSAAPVISIGAGCSKKIDLVLTTKKHTNLNALQKLKRVYIVGENQKVLYSTEVRIPIDPYINWVCTLPPKRILLWGQMGTGKSSSINTFATILNRDSNFANQVLRPAVSRSADKTVTKDLRTYKLAKGSIEITDSWGWEEDRSELTYNFNMVPFLLNGQLEDGFGLDCIEELDYTELASKPQKPYDVVIIVANPTSTSDAYLKMVNTFFSKIPKSTSAFVLLTSVDQVDECLRQDPYSDNAKLKAIQQKIANALAFNMGSVVPIVNYTQETERTWELDRAAFIAFYQIYVQSAKV